MRCAECGYFNEEGSKFCSNCGSTLSTKKIPEKKKLKGSTTKILIVILVAVIAMVVFFSYITFFSYDIEEANNLVDKANREIQNGNNLLNSTLNPQINDFREISFDVETESALQTEIQYAKTTKQNAQQLMNTITTIKGNFNQAQNFFSETENLRLPTWYHDYIDLKIKALDKDLERMSKIEELLTNYILYYGFAENYLQGRDELYALMDELQDGLEDIDDGNFSSASSAFQSALSHLRESNDQLDAASAVISLDSLDQLLNQMEHIDSALEALSDATQFLSTGNISQAMYLLTLANEDLEGLGEAPTSLLEEQIDSWYDQNIQGLITDIEALLNEVNRYEQQAQQLYDQYA
jgi:Arc/MetJ-type ribon-helix-helix transcriptional regulator